MGHYQFAKVVKNKIQMLFLTVVFLNYFQNESKARNYNAMTGSK
jgi:hypothetical protein